MRKLFTKIGIVLLITSSASPLVACSFNWYINNATDAIARGFANQTSTVLKSLVMSKVVDSDTGNTIDDIMNNNKNGSIINATGGQNLKNWGEFENRWGVNGKIDSNGFDASDYFKATGTGTLTKNVNSRRAANNGFNAARSIKALSTFTNSTLYNLVVPANAKAHGPIMEFLKTLQGNLQDKPVLLQLVVNLINNYDGEFIPAFTQLMDNLVNGDWDITEQKTPDGTGGLQKFMLGWKDKSATPQPYSQWVNGSDWNLNDWRRPIVIGLVNGHALSAWNQDDYNLYRGGTLINYLFWKISNDHPEIVNPGPSPKPRYLGDIISNHINDENKIDLPELKKDILQFVPFLLTNPLYPLIIIEGIMPIIKKWILEMSDLTLGVEHLTVSDISNKQTDDKSFNLLDVANTIKKLVNNPQQLETIIKKILGWSGEDKTLDTFLYDIKITVNLFGGTDVPLGAVLNSKYINDDTKNSLVDSVVEFLTSDATKDIINNVVDVITKLANQYPAGQHVDINLIKTKMFLLDASNGLLIKLMSVMNTLEKIIKKTTAQDTDIEQLYVDLGGNKPEEDNNFTLNSPLDLLIKAMLDQNSELTKILNLLFGNNDDNDKKLGVLDIITSFNNQWIKANYEDYFDANNTKLGRTYNISMQRNTVSNIETIKLKYNFNYTIGGTTYHFVVTAIDNEDLNTFQGIRNFKFKTIALIS